MQPPNTVSDSADSSPIEDPLPPPADLPSLVSPERFLPSRQIDYELQSRRFDLLLLLSVSGYDFEMRSLFINNSLQENWESNYLWINIQNIRVP